MNASFDSRRVTNLSLSVDSNSRATSSSCTRELRGIAFPKGNCRDVYEQPAGDPVDLRGLLKSQPNRFEQLVGGGGSERRKCIPEGMGENQNESVVGPNGSIHGLNGLYVFDSSVFSSSSCVLCYKK